MNNIDWNSSVSATRACRQLVTCLPHGQRPGVQLGFSEEVPFDDGGRLGPR
jgi:hypothetical protein